MDDSLQTRDEKKRPSLCCYQLDPTQDPRWSEFVEHHPHASVFHTVGWLNALRSTYGYEPVAFTTSPPTGALKNGLVFCRVNSWLTGRRLVSLPFSDHCEPLCSTTEELNFLVRYLLAASDHQDWRYLEIRPVNGNFDQMDDQAGFKRTKSYFLHTLNLRPDLDELFRKLDKDCVQRRIQRAERAGLVEKCGSSEDLLEQFYALFVATRGRHQLPPIPYAWFRNLIRCQGEALEIRLAYKGASPVSAILTLRFRDVLYYKYGCSDARFNNLGGTPWLLWRAIATAKLTGASEFDMGRTDEDNTGLLAFKNRWVPHPKRLVYWRFPEVLPLDSTRGWKLRIAKRVFSLMPDLALRIVGRLIYQHIG